MTSQAACSLTAKEHGRGFNQLLSVFIDPKLRLQALMVSSCVQPHPMMLADYS